MKQEIYEAAINSSRALVREMLAETRHENPEALQKIDAMVGDGCALRLDIDPGTGRIALCVFDGAVSVQIGVMEPSEEIWTPPAVN